MPKRGQITLFVIIGIILIAIITIAFYFKANLGQVNEESLISERGNLLQNEKDVVDAIDECVYITLEDALVTVSRNGGYYPEKEGSINYVNNQSLTFNIPIYYNNGDENIPDKNDIENALAIYVERFLPVCIESIKGDFEIKSDPKVGVEFQNTIRAEVSMNVQLSNAKLRLFFAELEISSKETFGQVKPFYDNIIKFNQTIEAGELAGYAFANGLDYTYEIQGNDVFYFLIWENYIRERPLIFSFGERKTSEFIQPFEIDEEEEYGGDDASENATEEPEDEEIPFEDILQAFEAGSGEDEE